MKRLIAVVLIVSMIFTTGGFATLADSVDLVVETTKRESVETTPHKYYDDLISENTNTTSVGENTDTKGVNDDAGAKLSEPEEKGDDEPSSNEYTEEPEVDETTAESNAEQDFDGEETTTAEVTTGELTSETTVIVNEETTNNINEETTSKTNASNEQTSQHLATVEPTSTTLDTTTESTTVVPKEITDTESSSTATESVATEENTNIENQTETENNISTNSTIVANEDENISTPNELFGEKENIATLSNAEELSLDIASLSEITIHNNNNLYGASDYYWIGTFEQGDATAVQKEPVKWIPISQQDDKILLVTDKIIHHYMWHNSFPGVSYADSTIRKILNGEELVLGDFQHKLFTQNQLDDLLLSETISTNLSNSVNDKIFLLSGGEAGILNWGRRQAEPTNFAKNFTFRSGEYLSYNADGYSDWWLRDPNWTGGVLGHYETNYSTYMGSDGLPVTANNSAHPTNASGVGIRPAIYVRYSNLLNSNNYINFNLKGKNWKDGSTLWGSYNRYQVGQLLPTTANIDLPTDAELLYWGVNGSTTNTITQIPLGQSGTLNLSAIYKFKIQWDLEDGNTGVHGSWDTTAGGEGPDSYIDVEGIDVLPTNVNAPTGKFFDHWEIEGVAVNNIPVGSSGNKTIKAVYGTLPNYVWYGTYPQNDIVGSQSEPIKWRVLSQDGNEALLVSEDIIDHKYFNSDGGNIIWRDAGIRQWLDNTFKGNAFTSNQINNVIVDKSLSTNEISGSVTTTDKVFLLSNDETSSFGSNSAKKAKGTEYAKNVILDGHSLSINDGYSSWWLRSQSSPDNEHTADTVEPLSGDLNYTDASSYGIGIRPAIYVDLTHGNFRTSQNNLNWNLSEASFKSASTLWNEYTTYQPGQKLPTKENLNIPDGQEFLGFRNTNNQTIITEIPIDAVGDITLKLQYKRNITWDLTDGDTGNAGTWNGDEGPSYYDTEFGISHLPTNVTGPTDRVFDHWEIGGVRVSSIPAGDTGDKVIRAVYAGVQYNITWNLNDGTTGNIGEWMDNAGPSTYGYGDGVNPLPTNVKAPEGKSFDHWEIDGVPVTSIGTSEIGERVIQAVYNNYPKTDFWFGTYPQNDGTGVQKEPIKWRVLNINDNEAFLVSDKILDYYRYYDSDSYSVEWEDSDARVWLNNELLNNILSTSQIDDVVNKKIYIREQTATTDRLFLLSEDEANKYFANDNSRIATDSNYSYSKNTGNADFDQTLYRGEWWLRTGVALLEHWLVCMVRSDGRLIRGFDSNPHQIFPEQFLGLRPAIYINFSNNSVFRQNNNSITFDFSNGGNFKAESALWGEMTTYQGGQKLPTVDNLEVPEWKEFIGWGVNGNDNIIYTDEIPVETTGDLVLKALYRNERFGLTFDMGEGHLVSTPSEYEYGVGITLPEATDVVPPTGQEFDHWEIGGIATTSITTTDAGDKIIKAIYRNASYSITWNLGGEDWIDGYIASTSYTYSEGLEALPVASDLEVHIERTFDHWVIKQNGVVIEENATSISSTMTGPIEIVAVYNNAHYNVVWHNDDGSDITFTSGFTATMSYTYSEGMALPSAGNIVPPATKEFDYWILRQAGHDDITYATSISNTSSGDVEVIAIYKYVTYTINYDTVISDATIDHNSVERTYSSADTALDTPAKDNYTFVGWYRDYDSTTHTYSNEYTGNDDIYVDGTTDYTIYAKWQARITYNVNGYGTLPAGTDENIDVDLWDTTTLPTLSDVTGYTFDTTNSWYDGSDISIATLIGIAGTDYVVTEPKILYARWNENIYDVNYGMNGGTWKANAYNKATRSYTERLTLPTSDDIEKLIGTDSYEFDGWWTMDGTGGNWGTQVTAIEQYVTEDRDVYAKWKSTASFNANGHGTAPASVEISGTQQVLLSSMSEIGWTFGGWYTSATEQTGANFVGFGGETISFDGPRVLYAKWTAKEYTINYNANGGIVSPTSFTKTYGTEITTDLAEPTKEGYTFVDWYRDDNTFNILYDKTNDDIYVEGTDEYTIYAKWTANTYTINYNANDGTITGATSFEKTYNTAYAGELTTPTKAGWTFGGWYRDNNTFNIPYDKTNDDIYVEGQTTPYYIYAKWNPITYSITYNLNNGAFVDETIVPIEYNITNASTITLPTSTNITRNHYAFDGWYQQSDFTGSQLTTLVGLTTDLELYAKWNVVDTHHTITFISGGGTGSMNPQYAFVGEDTTLDEVAFTRDGYTFNNWSADDGRTFTNGQNIGEVLTDLNLTATWLQNVTPYYPSGDSGSSGGSSGSGGGGGGSTGPISNNDTVIAVTKITQMKTIKAAADSRQVVWVYEPKTNKYKMNINIGNQSVPASEGFYLISNNVEQNVNGATINIPTTATYYFDREGNMVTGWVETVDNKWCYMNSTKNAQEGAMVFGWYQIHSKWYYFLADGTMLANATTPDGFMVGTDGAWVQ